MLCCMQLSALCGGASLLPTYIKTGFGWLIWMARISCIKSCMHYVIVVYFYCSQDLS